MSGKSTVPVYIDRKNLDALDISALPSKIVLFRRKDDEQNMNSQYSVCDPVPIIPTPASQSLADLEKSVQEFNKIYEAVGVLIEPWRRSHQVKQTYAVLPNNSPVVPIILKDGNTPKINFGKDLYVTQKVVDETDIPGACFVVDTKIHPGKTICKAGTSGEYNQTVNRTTLVSLQFEEV
jgi:hypothetical protein